MRTKAGLIIIFNHKFEKNLAKLRKLYSNRFSYIRFLVPFYNGNDEDVICVYENSFQFQGYLAQAYPLFNNKNLTHYLIIGDDLILNPLLKEDNLDVFLKVQEKDSYFEEFTPLNKTNYWSYQRFVETELAFKQIGTTYEKEIPSKDKAYRIAEQYQFFDFSLKGIKYKSANIKRQIIDEIRQIMHKLELDYPLVTGYSDFLLVSSYDMAEFSRICGIFAAMRLWVEIAIPTAMMFSCQHIVFQKDIELKTPKMWKPTRIVSDFEQKCEYKTINIEENWPSDYAYLHPVKLSKWS